MSTKSTILLTKDNEHWYRDGTEITLEFSKRNVWVDLNDDEDIIITVTNPDCKIYEVLGDLNNVSQQREMTNKKRELLLKFLEFYHNPVYDRSNTRYDQDVDMLLGNYYS